MSPKLSILLPVFNEDQNIKPLIEEIERVLFATDYSFEIIAIDDGSTDKSRQILAELSQEKLHLRAVFFRRNYGQTAAFDAGFSCAEGDVVVTMDSDRQNDPKDIPKMIEMIDAGYDFVSGWRLNRKDGFFYRKLPSKIANFLIRKIVKTSIHDLGCSLKAYRRELSTELKLYGEMHRFIGPIMEGMGARVGEIVVNHRPRVAGRSKYNLSRTIKVSLDLLTVWFMQNYKTKPSYIMGGVGLGLLGISGLVFGFVMYEKLWLDIWVHRNPLFILGIFISIVGFQFAALGIIAELIIRTYFESSGQKPYLIYKSLGFSGARFNLRNRENIKTEAMASREA